MKLRNVLFVAGALAIAGAVSTSVFAGDPIADRKAAMKAVGGAVKEVGGMLAEGGTFDAAKAGELMTKIAEGSKTFADLFPAGSDQGDTTAGPAIWSDMDGFKAAAAKLSTDAAAAAAAAGKSKEEFGAAFGAMTGNCKACHEKYRKAS